MYLSLLQVYSRLPQVYFSLPKVYSGLLQVYLICTKLSLLQVCLTSALNLFKSAVMDYPCVNFAVGLVVAVAAYLCSVVSLPGQTVRIEGVRKSVCMRVHQVLRSPVGSVSVPLLPSL